MKRKLLIVALTLIIVVGIVAVAGCQKTFYEVVVDCPTADELLWLRLDSATPSDNTGSIEEGSKLTYHFEIADYMDASTFKMYINDVETPITKNSSYVAPTEISGAYLPFFSYTIEKLSEPTTITFECKERDININFAIDAEESACTTDQLNILGHLSLKQDTNLRGLFGNTQTITTTYNQLMTEYSWSIPLSYAYTVGGVVIAPGFMGEYTVIESLSIDNLKQYSIYTALYSDGLTGELLPTPTEINITIDPTKLSYTDFVVYTADPLISVAGAQYSDAHSGYVIAAKPNNSFSLQLDTTTPGIDYSNATLKVNDTIVAGGDSDLSMSTLINDNSGVLRLSCGSAPVAYKQFSEGDTVYSSLDYDVSLEGVAFADEHFIKFTAKNNFIQIVNGEKMPIFAESNTHYYKKSDFPNGLSIACATDAGPYGVDQVSVSIDNNPSIYYSIYDLRTMATLDTTFNASPQDGDAVRLKYFDSAIGITYYTYPTYYASGTPTYRGETAIEIVLPAGTHFTVDFSHR